MISSLVSKENSFPALGVGILINIDRRYTSLVVKWPIAGGAIDAIGEIYVRCFRHAITYSSSFKGPTFIGKKVWLI